MPWSPSDAPKHDKDANTPEKQRKWAKIANAVLKRTGDDAMAIRVANSRVESCSYRPRTLLVLENL
jgi:uncharacterized protein YdaT